MPLVTVLGLIGFVLGGSMVMMFMLYPVLGLTSQLAYTVVLAVFLVAVVWYLIAKWTQKARGIDVAFAFREIPPE